MKPKFKGVIKFEGTRYEWSAETCDDSDELAVYLDLGNGKPEHIGYAADESSVEEIAKDELEKLSA